MRAPALVALALLGACARTPWVSPGWGWETARTEHFVLHSDRSGRTIERTLARFEETHAALSATFFSDVEVPLVEAVVLESSDYDQVVGTSTGGMFLNELG